MVRWNVFEGIPNFDCLGGIEDYGAGTVATKERYIVTGISFVDPLFESLKHEGTPGCVDLTLNFSVRGRLSGRRKYGRRPPKSHSLTFETKFPELRELTHAFRTL